MSKHAIITDTHFGARGDSQPMLQNQGKFFKNIFFPTLDKYQVSSVLHGGDYGDRRKYVNYQTANFIESNYRAPMRERGLKETILVGNRDCYYRHTTDINSIAELHRADSENVTIVSRPCEIDLDGSGVLLLPWICDGNRAESMDFIEHSDASMVLGHLELQGFQMYRGVPSHEGLDPRLFDRFALVLSGHYHHKSENPPVRYLGAPYPMIWSDYADARGFHIYDTDDMSLTFIENPYSLFARLVYDDKDQPRSYTGDLVKEISDPDSPYHEAYVKVVVRSKENPFWFDLVIDALYKANAQEVVVVDDIVVNETDEEVDETVDIDTLELVREYINTLTISCDKAELDKYMRGLYHKAMDAAQSSRMV